MDARLEPFDTKMQKSLHNLEEEFGAIRAGRANPHVLDKLKVDYYGTPTPIQSVANVSVPEPRMIQIQPWEKSMVKEIERAILTSEIGINPTNDGAAAYAQQRTAQAVSETDGQAHYCLYTGKI